MGTGAGGGTLGIRAGWRKQGHRGGGEHAGDTAQREGRAMLPLPLGQEFDFFVCFVFSIPTPKDYKSCQNPSVRRAEVTVSLQDKSGGAKKWPHTFGTRKRHSSTTLPSRGRSLAFSRSLGTHGARAQGKRRCQHRPDKATKSLVSDVIFKSQKLKTQVR